MGEEIAAGSPCEKKYHQKNNERYTEGVYFADTAAGCVMYDPVRYSAEATVDVLSWNTGEQMTATGAVHFTATENRSVSDRCTVLDGASF